MSLRPGALFYSKGVPSCVVLVVRVQMEGNSRFGLHYVEVQQLVFK
jgi:hypothetical protein